jgi:hypothetical protein
VGEIICVVHQGTSFAVAGEFVGYGPITARVTVKYDVDCPDGYIKARLGRPNPGMIDSNEELYHCRREE